MKMTKSPKSVCNMDGVQKVPCAKQKDGRETCRIRKQYRREASAVHSQPATENNTRKLEFTVGDESVAFRVGSRVLPLLLGHHGCGVGVREEKSKIKTERLAINDGNRKSVLLLILNLTKVIVNVARVLRQRRECVWLQRQDRNDKKSMKTIEPVVLSSRTKPDHAP